MNRRAIIVGAAVAVTVGILAQVMNASGKGGGAGLIGPGVLSADVQRARV